MILRSLALLTLLALAYHVGRRPSELVRRDEEAFTRRSLATPSLN